MTTPSRRASQKGKAGARSRRLPPPQTFVQRNRSRILWAAAAVIVVVLAGFAFLGPTVSGSYACSIQWTAPATPSPAPGATPRLGYLQDDMGRSHVDAGTKVTYIFCPPASGKHYNVAGVSGPIAPKPYGPNDTLIPQNWVHNLEHGALVLLYNCTVDPAACTDAGQQALRDLYTGFPNSPVCNFPPGANGIGPVFVRFDNMKYAYAALVWDEVLPLDTLDTAQIKAFWAQQGERTNPEPLCTPASPGPS